MNRISDSIKGYVGPNPFSDYQARNFSDKKMTNEFCPTSNFWSLFNDQHEIIIGTRGSGKTFLLRMMRYSMLKRISDPKAQKLTDEKQFIALYVPMHLEFMKLFSEGTVSETEQIIFFQFAFNCLLAESLITELLSILDEEPNDLERAKRNRFLAKQFSSIWFADQKYDIPDLSSMVINLQSLYYKHDIKNGSGDLPAVFAKLIGSSLLSVKGVIKQAFHFEEEPTWIICIDEAEFLKLPFQKCINTVFRSDSRRMAFKVATLPFYHRTYKTLDDDIPVSVGNDFNYRVIDMDFNSEDFINVTNNLCQRRLNERFNSQINCERLEEFVGVIGNDDLIDYYREEVGIVNAEREDIEKGIISELSLQRRKSVANLTDKRKPIYDKFAPIYFVREMCKLSQNGHTIPGWYAGSSMIRKISQGNPRRFIQLMNDLFEKARNIKLTPKAQHEAILRYANSICNTTEALELHGPEAKIKLEDIAKYLKSKTHDGPLVIAGNSFILNLKNKESISCNKNWIELATAYSMLTVDNASLLNGINKDTKYSIANVYSAKYWIPMRTGEYPLIDLSCKEKYLYEVNRESRQVSLFGEDNEDASF